MEASGGVFALVVLPAGCFSMSAGKAVVLPVNLLFLRAAC